ncbi:hypothetical protein KQI84_01985 [bacterium]|nr:hypothetical protein [bacterium]
MNRRLLCTVLLAGSTALCAASPRVPQNEIDATIKITPRYSNITGSPGSGNGVTAFSGIGAGASSDGTIYLERAAMGQPVAPQAASPESAQNVLNEVRAMLYYQSNSRGASAAAFRYKVYLFQHDDTDNDGQPNTDAPIRARYEMMSDWYGETERAIVLEAERKLRNALIGDPLNSELQQALLDLYYDRAVAELQFSKSKHDELNQLRLDILSGSPPDSTIPGELAIWTDPDGLLPIYRRVLDDYSELLNDSFAFKIRDFDSSYSAGTPLGYFLFQNQVPELPGRAAQYLGTNGEVLNVPIDGAGADYPVLYDGYRELLLLMGVLQDYTSGLADAARLYVLLADPNDDNDPNRLAAQDLIREGYQQAYLDGQMLLGVFPNLDPQSIPDSGLQAAIDGWQDGIRELTEVRRILDGKLNPLGFQPDFLILTTSFQGQSGDFFDSYNTLATWISELTDPPIRPLAVAQSEFERAQTRYIDYRGYQDQLDENYFDIERDRDDRAFELVGAVPGDANYDPGNPATGLIADQLVSIEIARNQIAQNEQKINNVYRRIQIEIERRGIEAGVNNAIQQVQISYGNQRAGLREEIGHWRAAQATAQATSDAIGNIFAAGPLGAGAAIYAAVVGVANVAVQTTAEEAIGQKEGQIERLSAMEDAQITDLQDQILDANSEALVKNYVLELATLAIDSQQAELTLRQETVRLGTLYNELSQIERFYNDDAQFASERFYADPLHYLRLQESVKRAHETFREAQDWLFYTARALEYKWNQPFERTVGDRTWSVAELYKTRNSRELSQMLAAMELYDGAQSFGPGTGTNTDVISLREDVLGYRDLDNSSNPLYYPDPITGELVRAKVAFRSYLESQELTRDSGDNVVSFTFSTAFSPSGSQFFLGPQFDNQGQPVELGTWLDKIQWIKINVPGNMGQSGFINGYLSDGGAQLVRNVDVGTYDPANPDKVVNEMTPYSSRVWFTQDGGETFEFRESLRAPIRLELGNPAGTDTLPNVPENTFFKERSVANTQWTLEFTTFDADGAPGGLQLLSISDVDDIELLINHRFTPRL